MVISVLLGGGGEGEVKFGRTQTEVALNRHGLVCKN